MGWSPKPIEIGVGRGAAVALYLDADEARALADLYGPSDLAYREIHDAVDRWESSQGINLDPDPNEGRRLADDLPGSY